ncbi:SusD family protein [Flaviramulus basaltis]|uniref:SusD family protein n=1 Tax=Flaviramulus basaltis TaxID=369401 RepID=A0A1K2IB44_9FLAO|nr:RagB/SusD family nutrient uptake outer membrane protein [Flaviramulus basaltis]SFZ89528.1 SusD family protein [Flaviramulus basaltis]
MLYKNEKNYRKNYLQSILWISKNIQLIGLLFFISSMNSCSDFVEVDTPKNILVSETVFEDASTVTSALAQIYFSMREAGMVSGHLGLSTYMGIYSDELDYFAFDTAVLQFSQSQVIATNRIVKSWWQEGYQIIYASNAIIEGLAVSNALSVEDRNNFMGQALFVRAYMHSLLVQVFGDVPYITTTNYLENNVVGRNSEDEVYQNIISDLTHAVQLMDVADQTGERVIPNQNVGKALLARVYLQTEQWELAETITNEVMDSFTLEADLNNVFLKSSPETIWQLIPDGVNNKNTYEANQFIIRGIPGQTYALSQGLLDAFETDDLRFTNWVANITSSDGLTTLYYPNKYKADFNETTSLEYAIRFRLSEQYLIRAEAKTQLGDYSGALEDVNIIRARAGLGALVFSDYDDLLMAIYHERRVELFTEQGLRWFDIKRLEKATEVLGPLKMDWMETRVLLPIPEDEILINPNLKPQNLGY